MKIEIQVYVIRINLIFCCLSLLFLFTSVISFLDIFPQLSCLFVCCNSRDMGNWTKVWEELIVCDIGSQFREKCCVCDMVTFPHWFLGYCLEFVCIFTMEGQSMKLGVWFCLVCERYGGFCVDFQFM